jgi:hypothetical protein
VLFLGLSAQVPEGMPVGVCGVLCLHMAGDLQHGQQPGGLGGQQIPRIEQQCVELPGGSRVTGEVRAAYGWA